MDTNKMDTNKIKKSHQLEGIKIMEDGKKFESYIGWIFCKELGCQRYFRGVKYSINEEKNYIIQLLADKIKDNEKDNIIKNLNAYKENLDKVISSTPSNSDNQTSKNNSKNNTSSDNPKSNEINSDISINNNSTKNNININLNINNINNNISDKDNNNKNKINKKNKDDISGDIDVIIPNVKKIKFKEMI